jgi:hypothetical protein
LGDIANETSCNRMFMVEFCHNGYCLSEVFNILYHKPDKKSSLCGFLP